MKNDRLGANVLSMKVIPNVDPALAKELSLKPEHRSLGIVTSDCDDVTYVALDEATKAADVEVVYGKSMYAGAGNASTKLAGEVIGIIAGPSPAEINSGLSVINQVIEEEASFIVPMTTIVSYILHTLFLELVVFFLNKLNIPEGEAIAYLIAPPLEAMVALDAAMKAADVQMGVFYGPTF